MTYLYALVTCTQTTGDLMKIRVVEFKLVDRLQISFSKYLNGVAEVLY